MEAINGFDIEKAFAGKHPGSFIVGVDEAGRGPLAGPVVAACVHYKQADFSVLPEWEKEFAFVRDSKTLSEKKREAMFSFIGERFDIGVGIIYPETIDRVNILQATFLAMKEAAGDLQRRMRQNSHADSSHPGLVSGSHGNTRAPHNTEMLKRVQHDRYNSDSILLLIDGNQKIPNFSVAQELVVGGDRLVRTIAAASIIAKVTRDRMMDEYDALYPEYGFKKHKGYGTKAHMEALKRYGPTPIHRVSFAPVAQAVMWFKELGIIQESP